MDSRVRRNPRTLWIISGLLSVIAFAPDIGHAAELDGDLAFPHKFMVRLASYSVQNADTEIAVADSSSGIGVAYSFDKDFGGEDSVTIPRLDAYYRFNKWHRVDFSAFTIDRSGREILKLDVDLADQSYNLGETLVSDIRYDLLKVAYGYSFYHSDRVELGFSAGLNITGYEFDFEASDGSRARSSDVTAPLPMFGLRMSYLINSRWSLHYISEAFYIEIEDALKGSFTNSEVDIQYHFNPNFVLGAGISRFSTDLTADDTDWKGRIADSHRGLLVYGSYYL